MKIVKYLIAVCMLILIASPVFASTGPIHFDVPGSITYDNGNYYLTIPHISVNGTKLWAKWKLNWSTVGWDLDSAGLNSDVSGQFTASGQYVYNPQKSLLLTDFQQSAFLCAGPSVELNAWDVSFSSSTTMVLTMLNPSGGPTLTLSRDSGAAGDINGMWSTADGSFTLIFSSDGSVTLNGVVTPGNCN